MGYLALRLPFALCALLSDANIQDVHPDINPNDADAQQKFVQLAKAYEDMLATIKGGFGRHVGTVQQRPRWKDVQAHYRKARARYKADEEERANRSTRPANSEEDWTNRATWYYSNISAEFSDTRMRKEVQGMTLTAAANSGGPDWGGYWAMAEMMQADAEERNKEPKAIPGSDDK